MARNTPGLREAILDKFQRYLGRTPSEDEMNSFLDNHSTGEQVGATIAASPEYTNGRDPTPDGTGTTPRVPAFTPGGPGDPDFDRNPRDFIANRDKEQWRLNLVDYLVRTKGLSPADAERMAGEEVTGIEAAVRNERNIGKDPLEFVNAAKRKLDGRLGNTPRGGGDERKVEDNDPGGGGRGGGGGDTGTITRSAAAGGFPTFTPPAPMALPTPYSYADYTAPQPFAYDAYTMAQPFAYDPYVAAQPFSYASFEAPTGQSMLLDPSYQFRLEQGQKALDASAANRGTLRTGSHLKDTVGYGQNFASQEYGNIYNRAAEQYGMNRGNAQQNYAMNEANRAAGYGTNYNVAKSTYDTNEANRAAGYGANYGTAKDIYGINAAGQLGAYNTNRGNAQDAYQSQYKTAQDLYQSNYKSAQDQYNAQQRTAELQFGREWDAYKYAGDKAYDYWNANLRADTDIAGYGSRS